MNTQCLAYTAWPWKASKGSYYHSEREMYEEGDRVIQRVGPMDSAEEVNY